MYQGIGGYQKQSILRRPARKPSDKNNTTFDLQKEKEEARQKALQDAYEQREYERLRAMYGSAEDKREIQMKLQAEMQALVDAKKKLEDDERAEEDKFRAAFEDQIKFAQFIEQDHTEARKEYERYVLEENIRLEQQRAQAKETDHDQEVEADIKRPDFFAHSFMRSFR